MSLQPDTLAGNSTVQGDLMSQATWYQHAPRGSAYCVGLLSTASFLIFDLTGAGLAETQNQQEPGRLPGVTIPGPAPRQTVRRPRATPEPKRRSTARRPTQQPVTAPVQTQTAGTG